MNGNLRKYISDLALAEPASIDAILDVEKRLEIKFPKDYIDFMLSSNGVEGNIGESYACIWTIEEIVESNEDCEADKYVPGLILFGSDGGDETFAFDMRTDEVKYVMVPYMLEFEAVIEQGNSLTDFFEHLFTGTLFDRN